MSSQNNFLKDTSLELEFDFALCHDEYDTDYHSYRYCRICA